MKTAEEILQKIGKTEDGTKFCFSFDEAKQAMKEYATEVAKEALKNASLRDGRTFGDGERYVHHELVISETNIPKT